ncbi:MAG: BLUF domain-containing protein [Alphaproteobacteria bacterium]|nr:BLUF domain-containing protein [Alphaproteobacteria bacterium]
MISCLVYVSSAVAPFDQAALAELLKRSRRNNAELGVTGLLVHFGGNFMQALEGEPNTVEALYDKISRDERHGHLKAILRLPVEQRLFPDWAMAFKEADTLAPETRAEISSFIDDVRDAGLEAEAQPSRHPVYKLMQNFVETMR